MLQSLKINNEEAGFCDKYSQNRDKKLGFLTSLILILMN